jgi:Ca2+-binding RTX toxin-like protein
MLISTKFRSWVAASVHRTRQRRRLARRAPETQLRNRRRQSHIESLEDRTLLAAALVGVDFGDDALSKAPSNWTVVLGFSGSGVTVNDLVREDFTATTIDLFVDTADPNGTFRLDSVLDGATVAAGTVPQHTNPLNKVDGVVIPDDEASDITARWSDLVPGKLYEVYVFAHEFEGFTSNQRVSIVGGNTVSFDQTVTSGNLTVNASQGSSAQNLSHFAQFVTADGSGEINITISKKAGSFSITLAALAIREAEFNVQLDGDDLVIQDISDSGDNNDLTITTTATHVAINDANQTLTTFVSGATGGGTNTVMVPLSAFSGDIIVRTGDGDDSIETTTPSRLVEIDARGTGAKSLTVNSVDATGFEELTVEANEFNTLGDTLTIRDNGGAFRVEALNVTTLDLNTGLGDDIVNVGNLNILGVDNGAALQNFNIDLGDGADILAGENGTVGMNVQGGAGDDILRGGAGNDTIQGGGDNDTISGNGGDDELRGGVGDDTFLFDVDFNLGSDVIIESPGQGTDLLDFSATNTVGVTVDLILTAAQTVHATNLTIDLNGEFENLTGGD